MEAAFERFLNDPETGLFKGTWVSLRQSSTPYKAPIRTALEAAGIPTFELKPREMDPGEEEPGVRLGTMHRIKGLEFRAVVLACGDADDPMNQLREAESRERCTRYVAATRAREYLLVTVCESPAA